MDEEVRKIMGLNRADTVLFFKDLYKTLKGLPPKDAGILMTALFAVANNEQPDLKGSKIAEAIYPIAADQMLRLEEYRKTKAAAGRAGGLSKTKQTEANVKQTEANVKQTEANAKQNEPPYPYPNPYPDIYKGVQRNPKVQKSMGFSTERTDVNYNEIAARIRAEREAAE